MTVKDFFEAYANSSTGSDVERIASFYADDFLAAGKGEVQAFKNDKAFRDWLSGVSEFNEKMGMSMRVKGVADGPFGAYFQKANVTWAAVFKAKPGEEILFDIQYLLKKVGDNFRIVWYSSDEDQGELMREKGVL